MAGAAPGVQVLPLRVLGKCFGNDADIQAAMRWAGGLAVPGVPANPTPARVVNLSLGSGDACTAGYQSVVDELLASGVSVVAAAGNTAGGPVGSPANCQGVIAVLALRHAGTKVGFSDLGPQITIAAPGGNCVDTAVGAHAVSDVARATPAPEGADGFTWSDSFDASSHQLLGTVTDGVAALMLSQQPADTAQLRHACRVARPSTTAPTTTPAIRQRWPQCHARRAP